jgi:hypothetical protein
MTIAPHALDLLILRHFSATVTFGEGVFFEDDRKILAQKLHRAIAEKFTPVVFSEDQCQAVTTS